MSRNNEEILAAAGWTIEELVEAATLPWSPLPVKKVESKTKDTPSVTYTLDDDVVCLSERLQRQHISHPLQPLDPVTSFSGTCKSHKRHVDWKENVVPTPSTAHAIPAIPAIAAIPTVPAAPPLITTQDFRHLDETLSNGWTLFPHQREAIKSAVDLQRVILAYDMGLGKTLISLVWAQEMIKRNHNCLVVILCPCTLAENWRRESTSLGFRDAEDSNFPSSSSAPEILVSSWAKVPEPRDINQRTGGRFSGYLAIYDESHYMQCLKSQRTRSALSLALHPSCRGIILATGTPMKNGRPCNILPLLMAIRHPIARDRMQFEKRYCDAKKTKFCAWDTSGATNLEELKERIGQYMLRKTKDECMKDSLPQLSRVEYRIEVPQEVMGEYESIVNEMRVKSKAFYSSGGAKGQRQDSSALEGLSALRQLTSAAKVTPTAAFLTEKLKTLGHIVVFTWFKETAYSLVRKITSVTDFSSEVLSGDLNYAERQYLVDSFQAGKLNVLVCTFGVGAVGLTLTRSSLVVLLGKTLFSSFYLILETNSKHQHIILSLFYFSHLKRSSMDSWRCDASRRQGKKNRTVCQRS